MLTRFQAKLDSRGVTQVRLQQADVLELDQQLPSSWSKYDLIVSTSMLEYVARPHLSPALSALGARLDSPLDSFSRRAIFRYPALVCRREEFFQNGAYDHVGGWGSDLWKRHKLVARTESGENVARFPRIHFKFLTQLRHV